MRAIVVVCLAAGCAHAADLSIGTATARPGERARGAIQVARGVDAATDVPVIVINGARPGPTIALVAGAHGTEYASILALHKLARSVDPAALTGAVVIAPLLNTASFSQVVPHLNPVDGKNMNRFYPGKPDGTQTERVSWAIAKQVVERCDYLIDLHGGDLDENMRSYAYWADTGKEALDSTSRGMVLAFGLDHIIIQRNRTPPAAGAPITVTRYAQAIGKPAIAAEAGHAGTAMPEDIDALVDGSINVMRHLKMLPGAAPLLEKPVWIANATVVTADREGVFCPLARPEAYVAKGMRVGYITDYFGDKVADVTAPVSGIVIYIRAIPSLKKGDNLADIGEIAANP
ncbi:MAG TPA: M14 family metallopeptidase [Candidatus Acidoferrales bacterium]|nr:M14 family metallopeptidase [Candidatus Acidoferrales bacterium]